MTKGWDPILGSFFFFPLAAAAASVLDMDTQPHMQLHGALQEDSKSHIHTHALAYIQRSAQGTHGHTRRLLTTHSVPHVLLLVGLLQACLPTLETDSAVVTPRLVEPASLAGCTAPPFPLPALHIGSTVTLGPSTRCVQLPGTGSAAWCTS